MVTSMERKEYVLLEEIMLQLVVFDGILIKINGGQKLLNVPQNILYMKKILLLEWMARELERTEHRLKKKICHY